MIDPPREDLDPTKRLPLTSKSFGIPGKWPMATEEFKITPNGEGTDAKSTLPVSALASENGADSFTSEEVDVTSNRAWPSPSRRANRSTRFEGALSNVHFPPLNPMDDDFPLTFCSNNEAIPEALSAPI
jgi:hypothetical protein